jgi:hypothetical protein
MPKIRDLGINVIPVIMRLPELGPGGGMLACPPPSDCGATFKCTEVSPACEPHSGAERPPHCAAQSHCADHSYPPKAYYAGGFTPDAVAQLRQQLRDQIGTSP